MVKRIRMDIRNKIAALLLAVFLLLAWVLPAIASDQSAEIEQLRKRIEELEKKQAESEIKTKTTEKKIENVEKAATKIEQEEVKLQEDKKKKVIAYYRDGFFLETADKQFRLQLGGVLHFDYRQFESGRSASSFDIRRARYDMRGYLYKGDIEHVFRLQLEMADTPYLRNAYWMFKFRPELNIQLGQFKIPSGGADWLTEEAHVNFIEYATSNPVSASFDRGINIHSHFLSGKVQTNLGVFTGAGIDYDASQGDYDSNKDYAVRLLLVPFKESGDTYLKGLHFAGSYQDGLQSIKTISGEASNRTENYESRWFRWVQNTVDLDRRVRYGGEFHWLVGSAALSYEFNRVEWEDLKVYNSSGSLLRRFPDRYHADVQQIWISYFLTGEEKQFEDVFFCWRQPKPKKNFSLKEGTWGAWEILARYALHTASDNLFDGSNAILQGSKEGYAVTGGIRWIWNPKVRIMFDANYLKSTEGQGIIVERSEKGTTARYYKDSETAFLFRLILTP